MLFPPDIIMTYSGKRIKISFPCVEDFEIEDIARGLANQCRFNGQVNRFYSVAEHSLRAMLLVDVKFKKEALLHDAAEAYLGDCVLPLKNILPEYQKIEDHFDKVIRNKFNLPEEMSAEVREADALLLQFEFKELTNIFVKIDEYKFHSMQEDFYLIRDHPPQALFIHYFLRT